MNGFSDIQLQSIQERDLELIMMWRMRPDITKYMNTDPILTLEGQRKWLSNINNDSTCLYWLILIDREKSGVLNFSQIDTDSHSASWGYYIANNAKRTLNNAIALEAFLYDYAFGPLCLDYVKNETFSLNSGVIQLHKLLGCEVETIVKDEVFKNNEYFDVTHMIMTKEKWMKSKWCRKFNIQIEG